MSPQMPLAHKIVLHSTSAQAGSTPARAVFNNVRLPTLLQGQCTMQVESFRALNGDTGAQVNKVYQVRRENMNHPHSYSSTNGTWTDVLLVNTGYTYTGTATKDNAAAQVLLDPGAFVSKQITVVLDSPIDNTFAWPVTCQWILTLGLLEQHG